jgi:hypothetical protein
MMGRSSARTKVVSAASNQDDKISSDCSFARPRHLEVRITGLARVAINNVNKQAETFMMINRFKETTTAK